MKKPKTRQPTAAQQPTPANESLSAALARPGVREVLEAQRRLSISQQPRGPVEPAQPASTPYTLSYHC
jgi:hypothetical protein